MLVRKRAGRSAASEGVAVARPKAGKPGAHMQEIGKSGKWWSGGVVECFFALQKKSNAFS